MLQEIMDMRSSDDFMRVSRDMISRHSRTELCEEMKTAGIIISSEDCWTPEQLHSFYCRSNGVESGLDATSADGDSAKLVHRLQLIGTFNPGLTQSLRKFIEKICV